MGSTNYDWASLVMVRCNPPITPTASNTGNFTRWMGAENPRNDWWHLNNPLNCGLNDGSADGAGSYPNLDYAATETARVLSQGNMSPIADALRSNASTAAFSAGCARSSWSTGGYHNNPGYIASVPQEAVIASPYTFPNAGPTPSPAPSPSPTPQPTPIPPLPVPIKEDTMSLATLSNGEIVISAVGAGDRNEHLLVFTLNPTNPNQPNYNVIDVTDGIGTTDPYTVQSA